MNIFEVSELTRRNRTEQAYVLYWFRHPDKGSAFERNTRYARWLPGWIILRLIQKLRYNGFLFYECDEFIGHVFFQAHPREWRVFSILSTVEGKGHAQRMLAEFLCRAHEVSHLTGVRIGAGGNKAIHHIWEKTVNGKLNGVIFPLKAGVVPGTIEFVR